MTATVREGGRYGRWGEASNGAGPGETMIRKLSAESWAVCRVCGEPGVTPETAWDRPAPPRCGFCGGPLERRDGRPAGAEVEYVPVPKPSQAPPGTGTPPTAGHLAAKAKAAASLEAYRSARAGGE